MLTFSAKKKIILEIIFYAFMLKFTTRGPKLVISFVVFIGLKSVVIPGEKSVNPVQLAEASHCPLL